MTTRLRARPVLKASQESFITVDYSDLEDFIKEIYGIHYNIPCGEEMSNDSLHAYNVETSLNEWHVRRMIEFKDFKTAEVDEGRYLGVILNDLCINKYIKPGRYLVSVCW